MIMKRKAIVLSLGGSLIVPDGGIDVDFLKKFNQFIRKQIASNHWQFFIVTGGGSTARHYQDSVRTVTGRLHEQDVDWLGIHATRLNAHLLRSIFRDLAQRRIIHHYHKDKDLPDKVGKSLVFCAGWKPGWSTDYDGVLLAQKYGVKELVNLSNIKMVYDKDPKKFPKAKPIKKISWDDYLNLVGEEWSPGLSAPFDPVASKLAKKIGLKVIVAHGHDLKNLERILQGKEFVGTVIE